MNFQKWSITDESERLSVSYTFMNDSRKQMSAFLFPFSTLLVKIFHAEHLVRFFNLHPLYKNAKIIDKNN